MISSVDSIPDCLYGEFVIRIVLVHPDIPQNTGNIARLCVGLDAELHLVHPMGFVLDDKKIKRAGLDYWPHLKLTQHDSLEKFMQQHANDRKFFLTTKTNRKYTSVKFEANDMLVFGSESKGLPVDLLQRNEAQTLTIPMPGAVRSLNVSNAVAVIAYEAFRQIQL